LATKRVAKLAYRLLRGPYEVVDVLEHGTYNLRKFGKPDRVKLKYHAEDISMLPPAIRPVEPLDGPDLRYLNNAHAPIPHPLKQAFDIKLYNEMWFSQPIDSTPPKLLRDLENDAPLSIITTPLAAQSIHTTERVTVPIVAADTASHVANSSPFSPVPCNPAIS
jgi:hypothetical protein